MSGFDYFQSLEEQDEHQYEAEIVGVCLLECDADTFQKNASQDNNAAMKQNCLHRIHPARLFVYMIFVSIS
jgi:hypothetical protein